MKIKWTNLAINRVREKSKKKRDHKDPEKNTVPNLGKQKIIQYFLIGHICPLKNISCNSIYIVLIFRNESDSKSRDKKRHKKHNNRQKSQRSESQRKEKKERRNQKKEELQKDPYYKDRRQLQKIRAYDPKRAEQMEQQLQTVIILDKKKKQMQVMTEKFKDAQKQLEEAKREDLTVLVYCLPLKAKQKDIWAFFNKQGCGKMRDIRIIKDSRSNRSKGVAYVQFYTSESVQKALMQHQKVFQYEGRKFPGLKVQHSQAEKNRAAAAAKQMRMTKPADPFQMAHQTLKRSMKVVVGGLVERLADIQQERLKQLFEPFGHIQYVDIHRDPLTGRCKGFAFIQYTDVEDAKAAVKQMNGIKISGQQIQVTTVNVTQRGDNMGPSDQNYLRSDGGKMLLMQRLSRDAPSHSNLMRPPISTVSTCFLLLTNLFVMEGKTPIFFDELKKEVIQMCSKYGLVDKIFVEKNNQGNVWVKFNDTPASVKAQESLNNQFFQGKKVFCYFVTQNTYQSRVGI